jgi:succinoglycan biosynthesis transport protein ExoP
MTTLPQTTQVRVPQPLAYQPTAAAPAAAMPAVAAQGQMTPADVWRVLRANMWLIGIFLFVFVVGGVALNQIWLKYWPQYTPRGYLMVETAYQPDLGSPMQYEMPEQRLVAELRTQAELLRSNRLLSEVLNYPDSPVRRTQWYQKLVPPGADTRPAKEELRKRFRAAPVPDSKLVQVSFTCSSPSDARIILTELVEQHLRTYRTASDSRLAELRNQLERRARALDQDIAESARLRMEAQRRLADQGMEGVGVFSTVQAELSALLEAQLRREEMLLQARSMLENAEAAIRAGGTLPMVENMVENDPLVYQLRNQQIAVEIELAGVAVRGPTHKDVVQLTERLEGIKRAVDERRAERRANYTAQALNEYRSAVAVNEEQSRQLAQRVSELQNRLRELSREMVNLQIEQEKERALREQRLIIEKRLADIEVTDAPTTMARVDWAANGRPEDPDEPSFPQLKYLLPMSIFVGLALALGIAFLREFLDQTVRSPRDIARVGQLTLLGMIADEADDPQAANAQLAIFDAPHSLTAEQFRQLRTRLQHAASLDTIRSIMITGPAPMDGKSTVAANLAAGLALNGRKVLLVDANFRRPDLHRLFSIPNGTGFSDVLNGSADLGDAAQATRIPNLSVLPSGARPANATELFESRLFTDFIERALEEYDHVIFDSGPFFVVSESVAMAPRVDGVITVIRAHEESRGALQRLRDSLRQIRAEHLGVVLNAVRAQGGGYYGRSIKAYYDYQNA